MHIYLWSDFENCTVLKSNINIKQVFFIIIIIKYTRTNITGSGKYIKITHIFSFYVGKNCKIISKITRYNRWVNECYCMYILFSCVLALSKYVTVVGARVCPVYWPRHPNDMRARGHIVRLIKVWQFKWKTDATA